MFKTITERKNENIKYFFFLNTVLHDMYFTTTVVLHMYHDLLSWLRTEVIIKNTRKCTKEVASFGWLRLGMKF